MKTNTTKSYKELGVHKRFDGPFVITNDEITEEVLAKMYNFSKDFKIQFTIVKRLPWYRKLYNKIMYKHK